MHRHRENVCSSNIMIQNMVEITHRRGMRMENHTNKKIKERLQNNSLIFQWLGST